MEEIRLRSMMREDVIEGKNLIIVSLCIDIFKSDLLFSRIWQ